MKDEIKEYVYSIIPDIGNSDRKILTKMEYEFGDKFFKVFGENIQTKGVSEALDACYEYFYPEDK